MPNVLDVDGASGKAAIYTVDASNPNDDAPLLNPRANLSRLRFHSDFDYVRIVEDRQVSIGLSALPKNSRRFATYNLFAHGRQGVPVVFAAAYFADIANWGAVHIGTPTWQSITYLNPTRTITEPNNRQLFSVGANATHVILRETAWSYFFTSGNGGSLNAVGLTLRVLVTDELL